MNGKISVLTPEPIKLVEEDSVDDLTNSGSSFSFSFLKAHVSDCTIVNGENGAKFAVWKVTLILQDNQGNAACNPRITTYMRYSEFVQFREELIQKSPTEHMEIPKLPPSVKWYESWRYQDVNLNKKWLAKRRQGLEFFLNHVLLNKGLNPIARALILEFIDKKRSQDR